jgi:hypothetical protein
MEFSNHTTSIAATAASNGTASSQAAPHRKNAAQRNRSDSPYQGRTAQKDNPTELIIKQAVDFLIQQVEAGKSETLTAYLSAMARFHNYSFGNIVAIARQRAVTYCYTSLESINMRVCASLDTHDGARRPV